MRFDSMLRGGAVACALAVSVAFAGCATSPANVLTEEQQQNRAYMSQVNATMTELDAGLDSFVDAVSRGDVVNMRTQAENAFKYLDELAEIEAPEALKGVHENYENGSTKLREALDRYVELYVKADQAGSTFDWSSYDAQVKDIQKLYDEGVSALEAGDKAAAEAK